MSQPNTNLIVQVEGADGQTETYHPAAKDPRKVPREIEISEKLGVGFESSKVTLARSYRDQDPNDLLKTIRCIGAGGFVASECRVHGAPKSSENGTTINGVGWMNHAKDRAWGMNFIDSNPSAWAEQTLNRRSYLAAAGVNIAIWSWTSQGGLALEYGGVAGTAASRSSGGFYTAPPDMSVAEIRYNGSATSVPGGWGANYEYGDNDAGAFSLGALTLNSTDQTIDLSADPATFVELFLLPSGSATPAAGGRILIPSIAAIGNHGIDGITASECLKYGLANGAPLFNWTDASIMDTDLELAQLMVGSDEKFAGLLEKINALYLYYAHVWEDRQFSWGPLSDDTLPDYEMSVARGDTFDGTGDQVDEDGPFNECYVIYNDVANGNRETMIGPDDSDLLADTSPTNVCNRENIPRHAVLKVNSPTSGEMASLYGYAYLRDHSTPNRQGQGSTAGAYVKTRAGAWVPSYQMRVGETVSYANDSTVRRIHGKRWSSIDRICDLEFDNLPYTTDSLFERIGIALVGIE